MNKKQYYTAAKYTFVAAAAAVAVGMSHPKEAEAAPNVIMIYADDLGYGDTRLTNSTSIPTTPNLASIAANGINFSEGYVASPVCSASRAALMSGRYPARFGFDSNFLARTYDDRNPSYSIASLLKNISSVNYKTMMIGKWDLGNANAQMPVARGFDGFYGIPGGISSYYPTNGTAPSDATFWQKSTNTVVTSQAVDSDQTQNVKEYDAGTGTYVKRTPTNYLTDVFTDKAVDYIQNNGGAAQDPFFLYLAFNSPHVPMQVPSSYYTPYASRTDLTNQQKVYNAMVDNLDHNVGEVLNALGSHSGYKWNNTMVVFVSDNGPEIGSAGRLQGGKHDVFEGGIREPFAIQWPSQYTNAGSTYSKMVGTQDLLATILRAAGSTATLPTQASTDLSPFVKGTSSGDPHDYLYWRYINEDGEGQTDQVQLAVSNGTYKYIRTVDPDTTVNEYLYDVTEVNPEEVGDNLIGNGGLTATKNALIAALNDWNANNPLREDFNDDLSGAGDTDPPYGYAQGWFAYNKDADSPNPDWSVNSANQWEGTGKGGIRSVQAGSYFTNFTYDADVMLKTSGKSGVIFRSSDHANGSFMFKGYLAQIEYGGAFRLIRMDANGTSGTILAEKTSGLTINTNEMYHIQIEANGSALSATLKNDAGTTIATLSATDSTYSGGLVGLRVGSPNSTTNATTAFDNIVVLPQ
ncbi:sulfatase-like hydrolase/transferase [Paenibacillus ferrarius]|uniref:sulfatase-like hydrolase/transferase n=1 Tax=Paenibacillus ferrarius TaxID=1469647 RepID=UPI003D2D159B